jgi:hypothetical protein
MTYNKRAKSYFDDLGESSEGANFVYDRIIGIKDGVIDKEKALQSFKDFVENPNEERIQKSLAFNLYGDAGDLNQPDFVESFRIAQRTDGVIRKVGNALKMSLTYSAHQQLRMDLRSVTETMVQNVLQKSLNKAFAIIDKINDTYADQELEERSRFLILRNLAEQYREIIEPQTIRGQDRLQFSDGTSIKVNVRADGNPKQVSEQESQDEGVKYPSSYILQEVGGVEIPVFVSTSFTGCIVTSMFNYRTLPRFRHFDFTKADDLAYQKTVSHQIHLEDCLEFLDQEINVKLSDKVRASDLQLPTGLDLPQVQTFKGDDLEIILSFDKKVSEAEKHFINTRLEMIKSYLLSLSGDELDKKKVNNHVIYGVKLRVIRTDNINRKAVPTKILLLPDLTKRQQKCLNYVYDKAGYLSESAFSPFPKRFAKALSDEEKKEVYDKWHGLINMNQNKLDQWAEDEDRLLASINREEAKDAGNIQSGYDSFHRIKRRKKKPFEDWSSDDFTNAKQEIGFNSRMLGGKPGQPVGDTGMSKWEISLRNWGHDPSLKSSPQHAKWKAWHKKHDKKAMIQRVASLYLNKR